MAAFRIAVLAILTERAFPDWNELPEIAKERWRERFRPVREAMSK